MSSMTTRDHERSDAPTFLLAKPLSDRSDPSLTARMKKCCDCERLAMARKSLALHSGGAERFSQRRRLDADGGEDLAGSAAERRAHPIALAAELHRHRAHRAEI